MKKLHVMHIEHMQPIDGLKKIYQYYIDLIDATFKKPHKLVELEILIPLIHAECLDSIMKFYTERCSNAQFNDEIMSSCEKINKHIRVKFMLYKLDFGRQSIMDSFSEQSASLVTHLNNIALNSDDAHYKIVLMTEYWQSFKQDYYQILQFRCRKDVMLSGSLRVEYLKLECFVDKFINSYKVKNKHTINKLKEDMVGSSLTTLWERDKKLIEDLALHWRSLFKSCTDIDEMWETIKTELQALYQHTLVHRYWEDNKFFFYLMSDHFREVMHPLKRLFIADESDHDKFDTWWDNIVQGVIDEKTDLRGKIDWHHAYLLTRRHIAQSTEPEFIEIDLSY
jgi:hypothetical protein